jgi:tryptophan 2,3-dioxygenase
MNEGGCPFGGGGPEAGADVPARTAEDASPGPGGLREPRVYGRSDLTYNDYLKVTDLLGLQKPLSEPAHHDELLFIIIHQAYELWFKLMLHELDKTIVKMLEGEVLTAHHFLKRVVEIMKLMVNQIHILETMAPYDFLEFRDRLNPASGFQSLQFREIEFVVGLKDERYLKFFESRPEVIEALKRRIAAPDLRTAFYDMLTGIGFSLPDQAAEREKAGDPVARRQIIEALLPIYQRPDQHLALGLLTESLVELDEYLQLWREHHVRVVERIIGMKPGTGGSSGVEYLKATTTKKCFPLLWEVRTHLMKGM